MTTHRMVKMLLVLMSLGLVLSGCANFIKPETGAIARPDARISLAGEASRDGLFTTKDLEMSYTLSESGNVCNLSGTLVFDRSLTDSFRTISRFILKMSFLDDKGRVLETIDITPLYRSFFDVKELAVKVSRTRPPGADSIAFNYFGEFKGDPDETGGDTWDIYYFPFD